MRTSQVFLADGEVSVMLHDPSSADSVINPENDKSLSMNRKSSICWMSSVGTTQSVC